MPPKSANNLINLGNILTIRESETLRTRLTAALSKHSRVELDCEENPEIDLWFIQLLVSLKKTTAKTSTETFISPGMSRELLTLLERGGFPQSLLPESPIS
jgi:hypothetical protein